jgi:hypothetical protein
MVKALREAKPMKKKYQLKRFHFLDATPCFVILNWSAEKGITQGLMPPDPRDVRRRDI